VSPNGSAPHQGYGHAHVGWVEAVKPYANRVSTYVLKRFRVVLSLLLIFGFSAMLVGKEGTDTYFPHAIGSSWVYEDADGNQFTRRAVKAKEKDGLWWCAT